MANTREAWRNMQQGPYLCMTTWSGNGLNSPATGTEGWADLKTGSKSHCTFKDIWPERKGRPRAGCGYG